MAKKSIDSGIMVVASFFTLLAVNALVIWLVNIFFPQAVVLGTLHLTRVWALVLSMVALTLINTLLIPFVHLYEKYRDKNLTSQEWMIVYFSINFGGVWLVARAAEVLGMGISSFWVAIGLAIILDIVQGFMMLQLEKIRK